MKSNKHYCQKVQKLIIYYCVSDKLNVRFNTSFDLKQMIFFDLAQPVYLLLTFCCCQINPTLPHEVITVYIEIIYDLVDRTKYYKAT